MSKSLPLRIFTHEFWPFQGGVASFCRDLAWGMAELGCGAEVWAPSLPQGSEEGRFAFDVLRYQGSGRLNPAGLWAARQAWAGLLQRRGGGLTILASYGAILGAACGPRIPPQQAVGVVLHGSELLKWRGWGWWNRLARKRLRECRAIFCNSHFTRGLLLDLWPEAVNWNTPVLPLAPGTAAQSHAPPQKGDPWERVRILILARVHPRKGQVAFIRACGLLSEGLRSKFVVQVAGLGLAHHEREVREAARLGGVSLEWLGPVADEDLPRVYSQCDIYALTPVTMNRSVEGFGLTFLEAGIHGKPVLGWHSGGVGEAVRDGETGLLVDEGDLAGLARAIARLVSDRALREKLGEGGKRFAQARSWRRVAETVLAGMDP